MKTSQIKYSLLLIVFLFSCSTEKNTFTSRAFHNMNSHYNIYFNGIESFEQGIAKTEDNFQENFSRILPVFFYSSPEVAQSVAPDMQRALEKATKVITTHSITAKPELKKGSQTEKQKEFYSKKEFNKWIDDNYLLMGKAYVYKNEFYLALETFRKVIADFPKEDSHFEALIWMARAYSEQGEYREAEKILNNLQNNDELPKQYYGDLYTSLADFYIKQGEYLKGADMLADALQYTFRKKNKIRYTYILAQLYQEKERSAEAISNYKKVIKMNPPYEMTFNAKINMASSFTVGSGEGKEFLSLLEKMLKDDKNIDFQDQIYYALGNVSLKQAKEEEAIDYFKLSASKSIVNMNQKGLSYLAIADVYYSKPDYLFAQAYYDSCLQNIDNQHDGYDELSKKAKSLNHLVEYSSVYMYEDSMQNLAQMSESELNLVIDAIIADVVKKEEEKRLKKQEEMENMQYGMTMTNQNGSTTSNTQGGKWYFYNLNAKSFGQPEFRMKWGNRKLEDSWRRKNKQSLDFINDGEETQESDTLKTEKTKILNTKSREFYLMNIPVSDSALEESDLRLEKALYNMGLVYLNEMDDREESIKSFKELLERYPKGNYTVLSAYKLYELYNLTGPIEQTEYYKNYIIKNFPTDPRALILNNPEYVKTLLEEQNKVNVFYEESYNLYNSGNYSRVISNVNYALKEFKEDKIIPRFMMLGALAKGKVYGHDKLTDELQKIVELYPSHEVTEYAKQIIEQVYSISPEIAQADTEEKAAEIYKYLTNEDSYIFGIAVKDNANLNQLNFNLINFNLDNYNQQNFGIIKEEVGDHHLLFVKEFNDFESVSRYYSSYKNQSDEVFKDVSSDDLMVFLISGSNYTILKSDTDVRKYYLYFMKYYQPK